jgi:catechol 2,3-dioxygenase-like lactoylglutathione lyase family enzyme
VSLKYESAVLFVSDIKTSKKFYCDLLGMQISIDIVGNVILENGLTIWQIQKEHIITRSFGGDQNSGKSKFELYFETEDLTSIFEILKENHVEFLHEIHEEPWGQRTVRFFDPDKNLVEIGESMKTFLLRMKNEGLDIKDIALKTGMTEKDIKQFIEN